MFQRHNFTDDVFVVPFWSKVVVDPHALMILDAKAMSWHNLLVIKVTVNLLPLHLALMVVMDHRIFRMFKSLMKMQNADMRDFGEEDAS